MKKPVIVFLFLPLFGWGQNVLTPEEAVSIALKTNYDILISANDAAADSVMNAPGAAGMLPVVYLNAGTSINQNHLTQRFTNGNEITSDNAGGTNVNAGVALSWTLFDGTRMFITKQRLEQVEMQGDYMFRMQVLNTASDVLLAYYDVVQQQQRLNATDEVIGYNEERVRITESRLKSGLGAKTDVLQAKIDLNVQKENRIALELELSNAKRALNVLLAREVLTAFAVPDSFPIHDLPNRAELESKMYTSNPSLLAFRAELNVSELMYREVRTQHFPLIIGNAGYGFNRSANTAGFSLYNQTYGWSAGLTLSLPLYTDGDLRRQSQLARISVMNSEFRLQQANASARMALLNAFEQYDAGKAALQLELENETLARENIQLALERLRLGQGNALEVAQAQATLATTLIRLAGLRYQVISAEINVHRQAADV